jgi:hypothetical protein
MEHHGSNPVLSVVVVRLDPRMVVAVGDAALADVKAKQPSTFLDRFVQLRIVNTGLASQDQRNGQGHPGAFIMP